MEGGENNNNYQNDDEDDYGHVEKIKSRSKFSEDYD